MIPNAPLHSFEWNAKRKGFCILILKSLLKRLDVKREIKFNGISLHIFRFLKSLELQIYTNIFLFYVHVLKFPAFSVFEKLIICLLYVPPDCIDIKNN